MHLLRDISINNKILIPLIIMMAALAAVMTLAIYGLNRQQSILTEVYDVALKRTAAVNAFISLSENAQSSLFRIAVLRYMKLPDKEIEPVHEQLVQGLSDMRVLYGRILTRWMLDEKERAILEKMKPPMDTFRGEAEQAARVVSGNPSVGILLVRSASAPFADFMSRLGEFLEYQQQKIARAEVASMREIRSIRNTAAGVALLTACMAILCSLWIGRRYISGPVRAMTRVMGRLASGDVSTEIGDQERKDEIGSMAAAMAVFRENTIEKNAAEAALRRSETLFRTAIEESPIALVVSVGVDEKVIALNRRFTELFGYTMADIPDVSAWWERAYPDETYRAAVRANWTREIRRALAEQSRIPPVEVTVTCKDGSQKEVSVQAATKGDINLVAFVDLTERKRAEKEKEVLENQLRQAQKMEAIATLTGGIAHDYNNLLSIIVGNLGLAHQDAQPGSDQADFLNEAEKAARKVGDLTHELMALSRGGAPVKELGSIRELLKQAANDVPAESGVSIDVSIPDDLYRVSHDPRKLRAVFRNAVHNAVEAMPDGGALTIQAENLRVEDGDAVPGLSLRPGDYVHVSIQDTGKGIDAESLDKIFDPYFSTKPMGVQKGMGLGLATAHAIVKKHGGHIAVNSSLGVGTTVNIYLPATGAERPRETGLAFHGAGEAPSAERNGETGPQSSIANHQSPIQRILVMDDEEMLRDLAEQMLGRLGYEVEAVADGLEAVEVYKKHLDSDKPFDAVILDLTIKGGMGGEQTLRELLKINPDVVAIIASGYFNDPVMADFQNYGFKCAIEKPFEMKALKGTIEKALD